MIVYSRDTAGIRGDVGTASSTGGCAGLRSWSSSDKTSASAASAVPEAVGLAVHAYRFARLGAPDRLSAVPRPTWSPVSRSSRSAKEGRQGGVGAPALHPGRSTPRRGGSTPLRRAWLRESTWGSRGIASSSLDGVRDSAARRGDPERAMSVRHGRLSRMLMAKRAEIFMALRRELGERLEEDALTSQDEKIEIGDRSVAVLGQDVELERLAMKRKELRRIDDALARRPGRLRIVKTATRTSRRSVC